MARIASASFLDERMVTLTFDEGRVIFEGPDSGRDDGRSGSQTNRVEWFGPLDLEAAGNPLSWTLEFLPPGNPDGASGNPRDSRLLPVHPLAIHRKSRINGMAQLEWDKPRHDFHYETPLSHTLYLDLPEAVKPGQTCRIHTPEGISLELSFDPLASVSEALHVNLLGGFSLPCIRAADLYQWMGDGGPRDYSPWEGRKVNLVCIEPERPGEVKKLLPVGTLGPAYPGGRDYGGRNLTGSRVWHADFTGFDEPGHYRLCVEGIGCTRDFAISRDAWDLPFEVSLKGFYYMRIGEAERPEVKPVPRQPRFIPGIDPEDTRVYLTTMHPWHPDWKTFAPGDVWDVPAAWEKYVKPGRPENPRAIGGHADALDWDRHLGHVSIIYDMLLPHILTRGALSSDQTGHPESGNGIPDLLDEARNEVDFWLNLRDGPAYGHGLTNPDKEHRFYQAAPTVVAAWANAANAAMLGVGFKLSGLDDLAGKYRQAAEEAYGFALAQPDQELDLVQNVGETSMKGGDFRMTAAAYLFDLTGNPDYEDDVHRFCRIKSPDDDLITRDQDQTWAIAGYLMTTRPVRYPELRTLMEDSVLLHARKMEADFCGLRPSRRASSANTGYIHTSQNVQRTLLAHVVARTEAEKRYFLDALVLEADWGMGRNPLNMIQMTTASTALEGKRSVENAYTSGRENPAPGLHPGHTPYYNMDNWANNMIMSCPQWMAARGYPEFDSWPRAECCFNTRWVWAHTEFTPQQTMRGKMALYGYLAALTKEKPA